MKDVLAHPLGPLLWALANEDRSLRKTNKAALARELEKIVPPAEEILEQSATIFIDGMTLIQKMKGNDSTFSQLCESQSCCLHFMKGIRASVSISSLMFIERNLLKMQKGSKKVLKMLFSSGVSHQVIIFSSGENSSAALRIRQV